MYRTRFLRIDITELRAFLARCALWLMEAYSHIGADDALLRGALLRLGAELKRALVLSAMARLSFHRLRHLPAPRRGANKLRPLRRVLRALSGNVFAGINSGTLRARIARLQRLIAEQEAIIARIVRRVQRAYNKLKPPPVRHHILRALGAPCATPAPAHAAADTS